MALIHSIFNTMPLHPSAIRLEISKEMDDVISQCITKDPGERFTSVTELLESFLLDVKGIN